MTHDELLAKIDDEVSNCLGLMAGAILGDALRAVVELHKPDQYGCTHCKDISGICPTIEAIEKELQ